MAVVFFVYGDVVTALQGNMRVCYHIMAVNAFSRFSSSLSPLSHSCEYSPLLPCYGYIIVLSLFRIGIFFGLISNMQLSISLTNLITNANITFANGFEFALNTVNVINDTAEVYYLLMLV